MTTPLARWSKTEKALLQLYYPQGGSQMVLAAMREHGGCRRTARSIRKYASAHGVRHAAAWRAAIRERRIVVQRSAGSYETWPTVEEDELARRWRAGEPVAAIAVAMGRSEEGIRQKARGLGLPPRFRRKRPIAEVHSRRWVRWVVENLGTKGATVHLGYATKAIYYYLNPAARRRQRRWARDRRDGLTLSRVHRGGRRKSTAPPTKPKRHVSLTTPRKPAANHPWRKAAA